MSELVRSFISYLSDFVGSRTCAPRRAVSLPLTVTPADAGRGRITRRRQQACSGQTLDISTTGLSFVVPSVCVGDRRLLGEIDATLRIEVELPDGQVSMCAAPVRYEMINENGCGVNFLIGARIIEISAGDRALLKEFLRDTKKGKGKSAARPTPQGHASALGL